MITPTIGRIVWLHRPAQTIDPRQPEAAQIVYVHNDRLVNVAGYNHEGEPFKHTSVKLVQGDEPQPVMGMHATWMPYQKAVASGQQEPARHAGAQS